MDPGLIDKVRALAADQAGPFYVYDTARIAERCHAFTSIPYADKSIHFASMANSTPAFLQVVREHGLKIFVNSPGHLALSQELGFTGHDVIYTASAMDAGQMRQVKQAGALLNLDSTGQLETWWRLFPDEPVGIRCNIGDLVEPRSTRGGYFLGKESRLGLTLSEIEGLFGSPRIAGLHLYVGTDLLDLGYFQECYTQLARLARNFPALWFIDFGGGFGLPRSADPAFPLERYGRYVTELMTRLSDELGRQVRLILEPGRIIGGEAGYFVCRVTDVKQRNGSQLIGVNGSSVQFPRPLFYPDDAYHPVTLLGHNGQAPDTAERLSSIYGCSTYSRDFFSRDVPLPRVQIDDLLVFGHAGSYCATAFTHFLGFPRPAEFFI